MFKRLFSCIGDHSHTDQNDISLVPDQPTFHPYSNIKGQKIDFDNDFNGNHPSLALKFNFAKTPQVGLKNKDVKFASLNLLRSKT